MSYLQAFLNQVTMYRLMLYFLLILFVLAVIFSALGVLPYNPLVILVQGLFLMTSCKFINILLAKIFQTKPNPESSLITGLILTLIIGPISFTSGWFILLAMAIFAMASKYFLTIRSNHIFNPVAFGAVAGAILLNELASWWIGNQPMMIFVLIGGLLIIYKIKRFHQVAGFLITYLGLVLAQIFWAGGIDWMATAQLFKNLFIFSPLVFFVFVMLVEPLTSPKTHRRQLYFGGLVALAFFALPKIFSNLTFPLEFSLLVGNLLTSLTETDFRQTFRLRRKDSLSRDIIAFWFEPTKPFKFIPGQFLEYTLPHKKFDSRGIRRYFTIASSPTEPNILLTTRFSEKGSSFKNSLHDLIIGDEIIASKVSGSFILPSNQKTKLAFIAGGIGITPFRSMIKFLLDSNEKRDMVLIYAARTVEDLVFKDLFEEASVEIGLKNIYVLSDTTKLPPAWNGETGKVSAELISKKISDWQDRTFYVSGPEPMVQGVEKILSGLGVSKQKIKHDYFPGYE